MEVSIIQHIQSVRNAFLDAFFLVFTQAGDELFFIFVAVLLYWCFDKRFGFKLINVYLLGASCIEGLKSLVARPRPYTFDGIVSVGEKTSGYSFPSGHSHSAANLSTQLSYKYRKLPLIISVAAASVLVAFSRLYLGQHFLSDVIVGLALGIGFALLFSMLFELLGDKEEYAVLGVFPLCIVILLVIVFTGNAAYTGNVQNVLVGYSAVALGYFLEKRYVKLDVKTKWYLQIVKIVAGLAITLAFKEGLKLVIPQTQAVLYHFVRYFLTALAASLLVPWLFKITRLGGKGNAPEKALPLKEDKENAAQADYGNEENESVQQ